MKIPSKFFSLTLLGLALVCALVFRRFVFIAWYPVVMSAVMACCFGLSLVAPKSLCEEIARQIPPGILPEGGAQYCWRLSLAWCVLLAFNGALATATIFAPRLVWVVWNCALSYVFLGAFAFLEHRFRRRRFSVVFHTSGSTSGPKTIVKPFSTLAREVAYHCAHLAIFREKHPTFLETIDSEHFYGALWRRLIPCVAHCPLDEEIIRTPESLLEKMRAHECVCLVTTPSFLAHFLAYVELYQVPQNCVEIISSGALLSADMAQRTKNVFGITPLEIYGSTEAGGIASRRQETPDCLWKTFDCVQISSDEAGSLVVRSPFSCARTWTMGDGVEIAPDGRHFRLLGRLDRLVKIAEERLSLPELEEKMCQHPFLSEVALCPLETPTGLTLGAVCVLSPTCELPPTKRALARTLRTQLKPLLPPHGTPKKYRFVAAIPRNSQGKILRSELEKILSSPLLEPFVRSVKEEVSTWSADVCFPADAPYFQGHFPSFPILPGVVSLYFAQQYASLFCGQALTLKETKKLKWTNLIRPNEWVHLTLTRVNVNEISFCYEKDSTPCARGVLCF